MMKIDLFRFFKKDEQIRHEMTTEANSFFKLTFEYLNTKNSYFNGNDTFLYNEMQKINSSYTENQYKVLVDKINLLNYFSNCSSAFEFYLPIISHILFYNPKIANELLGFLEKPLFALGTDKEEDIIDLIRGNVSYHVKTNLNYLTKQGYEWIEKVLSTQTNEIKNQIDICVKELEE